MKIVYDDGHSIDLHELSTLMVFEPEKGGGPGIEVSAIMPRLDDKAEAPPQVVAMGAVIANVMKPGVLHGLIDEMEGEIEQDRAIAKRRN